MVLFFFKQKTAYEMRISDWSSDVCSSDRNKSRSRAAADVAGRVVGPLRAVAMSRTAAPAVAAVLPLVCSGSAAGSAAWAQPSADHVRRAAASVSRVVADGCPGGPIVRDSCRCRLCQYVEL